MLCPHFFTGSHPLFGQEVLFRSASMGSESNVIPSSFKASVPSQASWRPISTSGFGLVAAPLNNGMCNHTGHSLFFPSLFFMFQKLGPPVG